MKAGSGPVPPVPPVPVVIAVALEDVGCDPVDCEVALPEAPDPPEPPPEEPHATVAMVIDVPTTTAHRSARKVFAERTERTILGVLTSTMIRGKDDEVNPSPLARWPLPCSYRAAARHNER